MSSNSAIRATLPILIGSIIGAIICSWSIPSYFNRPIIDIYLNTPQSYPASCVHANNGAGFSINCLRVHCSDLFADKMRYYSTEFSCHKTLNDLYELIEKSTTDPSPPGERAAWIILIVCILGGVIVVAAIAMLAARKFSRRQ